MRTMLVVFALCASALPAAAAPFAFKGDYVFKSRVNPLGRNTVDVVDTRARDATDRLGRLRAAGALCQWVTSSTVRCVSQMGAAAVPTSSLNLAVQANVGTKISFGAVTGTPFIVTQGTSLTEWTVPQHGEWAGGKFTQYRYLEMEGLAKLVLPGREPLWVNTVDGKTLGIYERYVIHESRWRWHEDAMTVVLEPLL